MGTIAGTTIAPLGSERGRRCGTRPFKCLKPEVVYGFRTVVSGTVEWPSGTVENHTSWGGRVNLYC